MATLCISVFVTSRSAAGIHENKRTLHCLQCHGNDLMLEVLQPPPERTENPCGIPEQLWSSLPESSPITQTQHSSSCQTVGGCSASHPSNLSDHKCPTTKTHVGIILLSSLCRAASRPWRRTGFSICGLWLLRSLYEGLPTTLGELSQKHRPCAHEHKISAQG